MLVMELLPTQSLRRTSLSVAHDDLYVVNCEITSCRYVWSSPMAQQGLPFASYQ